MPKMLYPFVEYKKPLATGAIIWFYHIDGNENPANILSKPQDNSLNTWVNILGFTWVHLDAMLLHSNLNLYAIILTVLSYEEKK